MPKKDIAQEVKKSDGWLRAYTTDLHGHFREILFPADVYDELTGKGVAYDGSSFVGINTIEDSDSIYKGDPETLIKIPDELWDTEKPEFMIICDIYGNDGKPHPNCPRSLLKKIQGELAKTWDGGALVMGSEPEAFFVDPDAEKNREGNNNYFSARHPYNHVITEIVDVLTQMGFIIERSHTEVGMDQFEINWKYDRAEITADRIQIFKLISHKVAQRYGLDVTFLPKPFPDRNGSGMHCHISVQNTKSNLFYDSKSKDEFGFSEKAKQFMQGILDEIGALSAIGNHTEVSFARLVPGFEAPVLGVIGPRNRSAAGRIPLIADNKVREKGLRVEFRFPDPLANPYLIAFGFIVAGLSGIKTKKKFEGFMKENLYELKIEDIRKRDIRTLPHNLYEAMTKFEASKVLKEAMGHSAFYAFRDMLFDEITSCQPYANPESLKRHYHS